MSTTKTQRNSPKPQAPSHHLCHCSIDVDLWSAVNWWVTLLSNPFCSVKKTKAVTLNKQFVCLDFLGTNRLPICQSAKNPKKKKDPDKRTGDGFLNLTRWFVPVHRHSSASSATAPRRSAERRTSNSPQSSWPIDEFHPLIQTQFVMFQS